MLTVTNEKLLRLIRGPTRMTESTKSNERHQISDEKSKEREICYLKKCSSTLYMITSVQINAPMLGTEAENPPGCKEQCFPCEGEKKKAKAGAC